jgi:hypothetical protein
MTKLTLVVAILALVTGAAAAPARHHHPIRHRHYARARTHHFSVEMRDDGRATAKPYRPATRQDAYLNPMVRGRLGKTSAIAALGYNRGAIAPTLGPHELNGAAETRLGQSESTAGVSVKVPF